MSNLLDKSEQNKTIAHYLHTSSVSCYPASVHCCYYSCLQKIIHFFNEKGEKQAAGTGSSHVYYINNIVRFIPDKREGFSLKTNLMDLRDLRNDADYKNVEITEDDARKAYELTEIIHKFLKKIPNL